MSQNPRLNTPESASTNKNDSENTIELTHASKVNFESSENACVVLILLRKIREEVSANRMYWLMQHDTRLFDSLLWSLTSLSKYLLFQIGSEPLIAVESDQVSSIRRCLRKVFAISLDFLQPKKQFFAFFKHLFREISKFSEIMDFSPLVQTSLISEILKIRHQMFGAVFNASKSKDLQMDPTSYRSLRKIEDSNVLQKSFVENEGIQRISEIQQENGLNMEYQIGVELYMRIWKCLDRVAQDDWVQTADRLDVSQALSEVLEVRELSLRLKSSISTKKYISSGKNTFY